MTKPILTRLIDEYWETSAKAARLLKDISTLFSSGQGKENSKRYWVATKKLQPRLMRDYFKDTKGLPTSRTRSYLLTRNEDGSLQLMDVLYVSQPTQKGDVVTLQCRVISNLVKL